MRTERKPYYADYGLMLRLEVYLDSEGEHVHWEWCSVDDHGDTGLIHASGDCESLDEAFNQASLVPSSQFAGIEAKAKRVLGMVERGPEGQADVQQV